MALLKDNPDGTKSGYKRPSVIQRIFNRSCDWENRIHHVDRSTSPPSKVLNRDIEPTNASQASHDRMELRVYAQDMERRWWTERGKAEKYRDLQIAKEKTVEVLKQEIDILKAELEDGVCRKCRERERIMASLPQDGSRGQKDAWDELLDRISTLEHERNAAQNEIDKLDERLKSSREQNNLRGRHLTVLENKLTELGVSWRKLIHESKASDPGH